MTNVFFALMNMILTATTMKISEDGYDYTVEASSKEGVLWILEHEDNGNDPYDTIVAEFYGEELFSMSYNDLDGCILINSTLDGRHLLSRLQKKFS